MIDKKNIFLVIFSLSNIFTLKSMDFVLSALTQAAEIDQGIQDQEQEQQKQEKLLFTLFNLNAVALLRQYLKICENFDINQKIKINFENNCLNGYFSYLHLAVILNKPEIAQVLLEHDINQDIKTSIDAPALKNIFDNRSALEFAQILAQTSHNKTWSYDQMLILLTDAYKKKSGHSIRFLNLSLIATATGLTLLSVSLLTDQSAELSTDFLLDTIYHAFSSYFRS